MQGPMLRRSGSPRAHDPRWVLLGLLAGFALAWTLAFAPGLARAQDDPDQRPTLAEVEAGLEQVTRELEALDARVAESGATPATTALREQLQTLERTYLRQRDVLRDREALQEREQEAEERLASGPSAQLAQPPPYVLAVLDALADARDAQSKRGETLRAAVEAAEQARATAAEALDTAEKARRREAEAVGDAKGEADASRRRQALARAETESRVAQARLELAELELAALERRLAVQRRDEQLLEETVQWVRDNLAVETSPEDATQEQLGDREVGAERARREAERETDAAQRNLAEAERRLAEDPGSAARQAEVAARQAELDLWQGRAEASTTALERLETQRALEERRLGALSGEASRRELLEWEEELTADRVETQRTLRLLEVERGEVERELAQAREALAAADPEARPWLEREVESLEALLALHTQEIAEWRRVETLAGRARAEVAEITAQPSLRDRIDDVRRLASAVWAQEIFAVDDRPITVGKIATGLLLFVLGFVVARVMSSLVGRLLVRRTKLATGAATAIQGLFFYLLLIVFFLAALRSVSIPLTAFTVLGGALAIGVGFGSQNIMNNFISGLILLAERPIKVGDLIEVEGQKGHVEWIGARSTRVRTFDNIHIVVPNSVFLERSVINWTLADDDVRTRVDVGVAYGSDTAEVKRVLEQAVSEHEKVLDRPAPSVFFMEFGDSSLLFRTYFWIHSRDMGERLSIESDVRYRIDRLCREAGVTIAFPQRDVHLDAGDGLPVRVVQGPGPDGGGRTPEA